jgi:hypothetical protein
MVTKPPVLPKATTPVISQATQAVKAMVKPDALGKFFRSAGKAGMFAGLVIVGTAALGILARSFSKPRTYPEHNTPTPANELPQPELAVGPAEGYTPAQWRNFVESGRKGQAVTQAVNPRMGVGEAEDMGGFPGRS